MTQLHRVIILAFISQLFSGLAHIIEDFDADLINGIMDKELDKLGEDDEEISVAFAEMARQLYAELVEQDQAEQPEETKEEESE